MKTKTRPCQNCSSDKGFLEFVGGLTVVLCSDCNAKIFEKSMGLTDDEIRRRFFIPT